MSEPNEPKTITASLTELLAGKTYPKIGATGEYPEGKLNEEDDGGLTMAVATWDGKILVVFGEVVRWIGLSPADARRLGQALIAQADEVER